jgi:hypothetical protein
MDIGRECTRKQAYLSKSHAKAVSRSMSTRHREAFHIYACPHCRFWHVGHLQPAAIRARLVPRFERAAVRLGPW